MKFSFQAKSPSGEILTGEIDATTTDAAVALLQGKGLMPLKVENKREASGVMKDLQHLWEGVSLRDLSVFYRQLSTLIDAKVSIVASLRAVGDQTSNAFLKIIILEMLGDIEDGISFSDAMAKHPEVFEGLAVSMVKAGELSGNLQRSVLFLAENSEKNYELNSKIKGALFYPLFVLSAALIIGFVVATMVLPKLTGIFKEMNVAIPWYTKILMSVGDFMSSYWWLVGLGIILAIGAGIYYVKTEDGKKEWDIIKMKIPIIGDLFQYVYISRFAENFAVLLDGGIPIVRALIIVSEVVNSTVYEAVILRAADEVKQGGTMSSVFARSMYFPPIVSQMIKIGEDTGKISEVLKNTTVFYNQETDRITRNLSTMLEPIMISFLGLGVGILVFSVLVPIYNIAGQIQ
ncbi:MAG: pilin biogenesis protein [Candidatus Moranbacteria bacterium GW2011_GWE1_36_7]|nr:MAG: pilin biogenesis protein [Candidatus Moranbacteria bacterium GW2011_GWD2_36_12]KKQ06600.1 MAG: pilin biogenesis protein [Candidatus Moranbacteria bacterium GW2011_GWE2_36_40]KKQ15545.1 MAG: pilin biogenesis protein [Candidatus Moranbacteria bacterium GW2011_GWE1_36_7]